MDAKMATSSAALVSLMAVACGEPAREAPEGGSTIHVLFDERHGLQGGELVRLHEFDIGVVESVDLARGRVRASVSLSPEARANLTTATTFTVEGDDGGRYLQTHILDADAEPLGDGAEVAGADGNLELMAMRASAAAGNLTSSDWWDKASGFVDDLKKDFDETDWSREEQELRERWEKTLDEMDDAADQGREELAERVDDLADELEKVGRSEEAQELRKRFRELLDDLSEG